ncbi:CoA-binding protein [Mesorhizobium sp. L-8-10]|uniref:acetate--CoA ligase family protein n=1 Tax=Mesorhizobium sp. L-8-10 TaxID=2744523 RepID=UPI001928A505|nr:acetate--CoA ligase family protein [Mesorhizobium sp. L-8-10]BCH28945.1 CoA-binding protein [Mesorhizobium sp. L-8-10]
MTTSTSFETLFRPRSIAIVGASSNPLAIGGQPIRYLREKSFDGDVFPINPRHAEIGGLKSYPSLAALPSAPDLVVVAVAAAMVPDIILEAGRLGVRFAIVFSSGFAETGPEGEALQVKLESAAEEGGIRIVGPNCQGMMNIADGVRLGFGVPYGLDYEVGGTSLTSQSGAFGNSIVMGLNGEGVGLRHYVSTGNEADVSTLDLIDAYLDDDGTTSVGAYVEGLRDGVRLRQIALKALRLRKPLVVWKVGNTDSGARAAASHTANLAGHAGLYFSAFRQFGIIDVDDIADMADCLKAFAAPELPASNRVLMVTLSGGAGIAMTDRTARYDLATPPLGDGLFGDLRKILPAFASVSNPLDVTAEAISGGEAFGEAIRLAGQSGAFDMVAIGLAAIGGVAATRAVTAIADMARSTGLPVTVSWTPIDEAARKGVDLLRDAGIAVYPTPARCIRGLGALWRFAEARKRLVQMSAVSSPALTQGGSTDLTTLNEAESKAILRAAGIEVPSEKLVRSADDAVAAAGTIGYPVVLKIVSRNLPHKSDIGGVRIGLGDAAAVRAAYEDIVAIPARLDRSVEFEGVLVAPMLPGGVEVIVGGMCDPALGPAVMFGAGGIHAEAFGDVAFRLAPLTRGDALAMIAETKVADLLAGFRGAPPADVEALVDLLLKVSTMLIDQRNSVCEVDMNPVFVRVQGEGADIADAVVSVTSAGPDKGELQLLRPEPAREE